ncbi:gluconate 2-dehydrogenase subunit 3 family protein [Niabella hibiscisoli]|nr:gluconate 2-dehydrogenase subunit 3 family protein [Niabella hibiscisoli]MCH5720422.1 gluconate 2-dehydrogenase subunit 3 family protein [Niabella hibiscisoli]
MNRRKFLKGSLVLGSLSVLGFGSYKAYSIFRKPDYKYLQQHKALIAEACETVIPKTDTPGAKDAKVEEFVIHCVQHMISTKEANIFIDGLQFIDDYCKKHYKKVSLTVLWMIK